MKVYQTVGPEGFGVYEVEWKENAPVYRQVSKAAEAVLIPGFVDLHIHGAFGVDFMSASKADLQHLCAKLAKVGYEAFLPTTVTTSAGSVALAIHLLPEDPMIAGFHLEGPFISSEYPGAQPKDAIEPPPVGPSEWDAIFEDSRLKIVTLAPELPHALELTTMLMKRGVLVQMGHSNATFEEARRGFEFGAHGLTHTFNAMRSMHHRELGIAGYGLSNDALATELIYDRRHVSRDAAGLLFKCKPSDKVVAVSDSTMATGLTPGSSIKMWGQACVVEKGHVRLRDGGALAGSCITLYDAFRFLAEDFGLETAIRACCLNPRQALKMTDPPRVWVELDRDLKIVGRRSMD